MHGRHFRVCFLLSLHLFNQKMLACYALIIVILITLSTRQDSQHPSLCDQINKLHQYDRTKFYIEDYLRFSSYTKIQASRNSFLPNLQTETGIVSISHFSNTTTHSLKHHPNTRHLFVLSAQYRGELRPCFSLEHLLIRQSLSCLSRNTIFSINQFSQ